PEPLDGTDQSYTTLWGTIVEKRLQTRLLFEHGEGEAHDGGSRIIPPTGNHAARNPLTAVNPNSEP
ncbi:hypothetical protein, partial [Methylosinus sp. KRF6]|uniref:hypothetical protein n=1 Tax=Methylosinus sp. KRF6 TaxID=2846853 RepID=UPI001C0AC47D